MKKYPISKATNAFDLFTETIEAIEEEPRRFNMAIVAVSKAMNRYEYDRFIGSLGSNHYREPECGTVCCFGGWMSTLKGAPTGKYGLSNAIKLATGVKTDPYGSIDYVDQAKYTEYELDMYQQLWRLFHDTNAGDTRPGTKAHVRYMVKQFRAFQEEHATFLKQRDIRKVKLLGTVEPRPRSVARRPTK